MVHREANTRLVIGSNLTQPIKVTFSFRQGDSLSLPLYCLQREPLLRRVAAVLSALTIGSNPVVSFKQVDEGYRQVC